MNNLYLLFGEERFLIKRKLAEILNQHPGAEIVTLEEPKTAELIEKITTPSLFNPQRVFMVSNYPLFSGEEEIMTLLTNLPAGVILIFDSPPDLDRRKKIFKIIEEKGEVVECRSIPEWQEEELIAGVAALAGELGKTINRSGAELLIEFTGRNLGLLHSELEKLAVYIKDRQEIKEEDIRLLSPRIGVDAYSLSGALLRRDQKGALASLRHLLNDREDPVGLLGLLAVEFRTLYKTKLLKKRGLNQYQISQQIKSSPYFISKILGAVDRFGEEELESDLKLLYQTDLRLKSGFDSRVELELLVTELSGAKR